MKSTIQFLGAAKTVTGSRTLLSVNGKKILVDCGLFQGPKRIRNLNWNIFENAEEIDAVLLTHAHIDHSGYLPKLVKEGFNGPIYSTFATRDLCEIMLLDSAYLQEEDASFANRTKYSKHSPALPLYEVEDAERAIRLLTPIRSNEWNEIFPGLSLRLSRSGHILGSSFVQVISNENSKSKIVTFSGDLGNQRQRVIKGPVSLIETDELILEGTYGDRLQSREDPSVVLANCINEVIENNGVLVIPAFAVGRTQELLFLIRELEEQGRISEIPVFLDSPMANEVTEIYLRYPDELNFHQRGAKFLSPLSSKYFKAVRSTDESMMLCMRNGPMIVISAAGMLTGGRILHHLKARLPYENNIVLFVGFQSEETKGRLLQNGFPKIRIHHQEVEVNAKIVSIDGLSAHADTEDLIQWVKNIEKAPKRIFLNHGEEPALNALKYRLEAELGIHTVIPSMNEVFEI